MKRTPMDMIKGLKDPGQIFDLICAANYFCGNFNQNMPVDNNREAFEIIKKLLKEPQCRKKR